MRNNRGPFPNDFRTDFNSDFRTPFRNWGTRGSDAHAQARTATPPQWVSEFNGFVDEFNGLGDGMMGGKTTCIAVSLGIGAIAGWFACKKLG